MELKLFSSVQIMSVIRGLNCTVMELKLGVHVDFNQGLDGLNCTVMELKPRTERNESQRGIGS